jgi:hypothetical protein
LVIQSSYDPEVEFMELAVTVGSTRDWLVHRPDVNGRYGGLQGAGGLDAVVNDGTSVATGIVSDIYGHTEATITGSALTWNSVRSAGLDMDSNHEGSLNPSPIRTRLHTTFFARCCVILQKSIKRQMRYNVLNHAELTHENAASRRDRLGFDPRRLHNQLSINVLRIL